MQPKLKLIIYIADICFSSMHENFTTIDTRSLAQVACSRRCNCTRAPTNYIRIMIVEHASQVMESARLP